MLSFVLHSTKSYSSTKKNILVHSNYSHPQELHGFPSRKKYEDGFVLCSILLHYWTITDIQKRFKLTKSDIEHIPCEIIKSSFTCLTIFLQERNSRKSEAMMFSLCLHAKPQLLSELATMFPSSFAYFSHLLVSFCTFHIFYSFSHILCIFEPFYCLSIRVFCTRPLGTMLMSFVALNQFAL